MDIFRFNNNGSTPTKMERGVIIDGLDSKMWIERYREAGEFEITGKLDRNIRTNLPIGSFISHLNSNEIMIVEDHQLTDDGKTDPIVKVTGRSFETFLDNRIVGTNKTFPTSTAISELVMGAQATIVQATVLVQTYTAALGPNYIPYFQCTYDSSNPGPYETEERPIKRGSVYRQLLDILEVDNLGIMVIRPHRRAISGIADDSFCTFIHKGVDRRASILFSHSSGEIERADYLWSNKKFKNCAYVSGRWVDVVVGSTVPAYDRRMLWVDANDIDQAQTEYPTGLALTWIREAMATRGRQVLAAQKNIALTKAEISEENPGAEYRKDYELGDLVSVSGNYGTNNESSAMRVTEYVEIEDETGTRGYPTLEIEL